ncbi:hypothetical protein CK203_067805 [Vitis vinifera]|uniref:Neprosin PEP catalytic domain-containing protein n=1 Tax=Vitis vinifera TaxID=29760 RepID=A0A438BZE0_VITVI|nr:hypothetical protein CK203_067805 [Vitis vinifera]
MQTKYGDIYDCVDFYKQPAFDHPLLKKHNFHPETRPISIPKRLSPEKEVPKPDSKPVKMGLEGDRATEAEWGGEVFSPPDVPSPGMGSGHLLKLDTRYDAFSAHTNILVNNTIMNPGELLPIEDVNNFTVSDQGNVGGDIRYLILYGGPGGVTGN